MADQNLPVKTLYRLSIWARTEQSFSPSFVEFADATGQDNPLDELLDDCGGDQHHPAVIRARG
jgi:hypothetical protein